MCARIGASVNKVDVVLLHTATWLAKSTHVIVHPQINALIPRAVSQLALMEIEVGETVLRE